MTTITHAVAQARGKMLYENITPDYSWTGYIIYKVGAKYAYFMDAGCSCNGAWEDLQETSMLVTKTQLRKLATEWAKTDGWNSTERETGWWVLENI